MKTVDQLLAKAMSTYSEEEAIACLRMARKKGSTSEHTDSSYEEDLYNGRNAKYWYEKANEYYQKLKQKSERPATQGLSLEQQSRIIKMYEEAEKEKRSMYERLYHTQISLNKMKELVDINKSDKTFNMFIFCVILILSVSFALMF